MRNLRSSAPFPLAVRQSGWHKSICTADPRRHETANLDWNAKIRHSNRDLESHVSGDRLYHRQQLVRARRSLSDVSPPGGAWLERQHQT
jgi:hypothetical protein